MLPDLTPKQQHFLEYLKRKHAQNEGTPSLRQAAADIGISHMAVAQFIRALEAKGYIKRDGRYSRKIILQDHDRPLSETQPWRQVPIIGKIAAGLPLYAQQEWDGTIGVDGQVYQGRNLFALRVVGDSMKDAGILASDLVICEPRQYAHNGEIVVALIREEATVKRFYLGKNHIELRPENKAYPVQHFEFGEVLIQGKVIGVIRGPEQLA